MRVQTPAWHNADFGWNSKYWREFGAPWGTMFAAPEVFAVICQLILNGGEVGRRLVHLSNAVAAALMEVSSRTGFPARLVGDLPEFPL